ncbi:DMT family transporter [Subtercola boreus]|uniref:DMT family transporter n=1 Tax=Subtercola boreus TaxID=120213 RepID=UPI000E2FAF28|nr:DMT family transporter [Subtercola boreus]
MTSPERSTSRNIRAATLLVVAAAVCFGTTGTAHALGAGDASALSLGSARIVFGGALLALVALTVVLRSRSVRNSLALNSSRRNSLALNSSRRNSSMRNLSLPDPSAPDRSPRTSRLEPLASARRGSIPVHAVPALLLVVVGAVGVAAYQPNFFTGTHENGVADGTLVALGSAPVLTGLLEWGVRRRAPGVRWGLAAVVAAAGVAVLSGILSPGQAESGASGPVTTLGLLGSLGAGASYAVYALSSKLLLDRGWLPTVVMGTTFGVAALFMTPVLVTSDLSWLGRTGGLVTTAWLAVVTVALAYTLFARGLRSLPSSRVATLTLVEPLTATMLGVLLLSEQFTAAIIVGLLLLTAGILILTLDRRPPRIIK